MNVVTIMNYDKEPYIKMCKVFIREFKRHNEDVNLHILYESDIDNSIVEYSKKFNNINFHQRESCKNSWMDHHNVNFKLYNLCKIREPFIFLDSDIFCLSSLDHIWSKRNDKPFIGIDHQLVPGHTDQFNFKFLNSGVQIVGDPEWYQFDKFRDAYENVKGKLKCPGFDQAHIFTHCKLVDYDYTHPEIGYEWNSYAKYGEVTRDKDTWKCVYNGPARKGEGKSYKVHLNHYWWNQKPWTLNCLIFNSINK